MELRVELYGPNIKAAEGRRTIRGMADIMALGYLVSRAVRERIRTFPITPHWGGGKYHLYLRWDGLVKPKPKPKPAEVREGAEDPDYFKEDAAPKRPKRKAKAKGKKRAR